MTSKELIDSIASGSLDTTRWDDALLVAKDGIEHEDLNISILRAWNAGDSWVFDMDEVPASGEERFFGLEFTPYYNLIKGQFVLSNMTIYEFVSAIKNADEVSL